MGAIVVFLFHCALQLLREQGDELPAETGAADGAAFAHTIVRYLHLQISIGTLC